jgi:hypothetical protein
MSDGDGQKKRFVFTGNAKGRGKVSTSVLLQSIDMSFLFRERKN